MENTVFTEMCGFVTKFYNQSKFKKLYKARDHVYLLKIKQISFYLH